MVHKNDDNIEMECMICLKLFTSDKALKKHKMKEHKNVGILFQCTDCGKTFDSENKVKIHKSNVHVKKIYKFCDTDISAGNFKRHQKEKHLILGKF